MGLSISHLKLATPTTELILDAQENLSGIVFDYVFDFSKYPKLDKFKAIVDSLIVDYDLILKEKNITYNFDDFNIVRMNRSGEEFDDIEIDFEHPETKEKFAIKFHFPTAPRISHKTYRLIPKEQLGYESGSNMNLDLFYPDYIKNPCQFLLTLKEAEDFINQYGIDKGLMTTRLSLNKWDEESSVIYLQ